MDQEFEENESVEESFNVVGRVRVAETEAVFDNINREEDSAGARDV